jgi:cytochrome c-type biogenesis protein CcmE
MNPKYRRLTIIIFIIMTLGLATKLILMALEENIVYFFTPNEIKMKFGNKANIQNKIRIGGLVLENSVIEKDGINVFNITDRSHQIEVLFDGLLPDLFREGQGIVVEGVLQNNKLVASQVLAKHDENYMPPEVTDALIKNGVWQGEKNDP